MKAKRCMAAAAVLIVCLCVLTAYWRMKAEPLTAEEKSITVTIVHKDGSTKTLALTTDDVYLGDALLDNGVIEGDEGPYGLYITAADGETADESQQQWWCITKNGEFLATGADATPIADGETYEITFTDGW